MKVFPFKIPKAKEESIIYQRDFELVLYDKLHQHEEIQISYIESGEGTLIVGDTISEYNDDDIIIFGSNLPHVLRSEPREHESLVHSIFFNSDSITDSLSNLAEFKKLNETFENTKNGVRIHSKKEKIKKTILKLSTAKDTKKFILFLKLLKYIESSSKTPLSNYRYEKNLTDTEGKRMQMVFEYVMTNFDKKLSLDEVANIANMTKNAFCRYFKTRTNKTFFQFLIELRVEKATRLLVSNKEASIIEIAELSGFNNISNFNRKFKEIKKIAPLQYKKNWHKKTAKITHGG